MGRYNTEMTQMQKLPDVYYSSYYKNAPTIRKNTLETNGKIECLRKEIKDIKKYQMEILELNVTTEIQTFTWWVQQQNRNDKRTSEFEDIFNSNQT